jgi:two-component system sensor histidine kinase/response regulator
MTADVVGAAREECLAAGMNDFVSKPFVTELLLLTIARWTSAGAKDKAPAPSCTPAVVAALPASLPGIDVAEGLRYLGGYERTYRNLLKRFRLDHGQGDHQIARLVLEGKRSDAEREAHSVKGLAAQMGAHDLCACAARLESALKKDSESITPPLTAFSQALAVVMHGLARVATDEAYSVPPLSSASGTAPDQQV